MDDEEVLRDTIASMLNSLGYTVIETANGTEFLKRFNDEFKNNRPVVAAVLDLTIPGGMGGREVKDEIRKTGAFLPVFVTSGYFDDPIMANPARFGFTASIRKPFRKSELIDMLNTYMKHQILPSE